MNIAREALTANPTLLASLSNMHCFRKEMLAQHDMIHTEYMPTLYEIASSHPP